MARKVDTTSEKKQKEILKEGTYQAVLYAIVDLGTQWSEKFSSRSRKIRLSFEIPSEMRVFKKELGEQPIALHKEYTLSFSEKSNLRKDLMSRTDSGFKDGQDFDLELLLGKNCLLSVQVAKTTKGIEYNVISGISGLPKGMIVQQPINKIFTYKIDDGKNEVFDNLPQFLQERILKAMENSNQTQIDAQEKGEDLPF